MTDVDETLSVASRGPASGVRSPGSYLVLAMQCDAPLEPTARISLDDVDEVVLGRAPARDVGRRIESGRVVLHVRVHDPRMSSTHARLRRNGGVWVIEDAGSKNGTFLNGGREQRAELEDGDLFELGHTFLILRTGVAGAAGDVDAATLEPADPGFATLVPQLAADLDALARVASSAVAVVLHGETGTGKEVIARAVHRLSRRSGSFVAVNCGALPETLVEAELFGHRKGAFSGAETDRVGLIKAAHKGTLLLDEIGDLRAPSQAALLRVLQEREVLPVGATAPIPVDFRLVAATHRDLDALVRQGEFRNDLLARISGVTVRLPALRDRREDLGLLCAALLQRLLAERAEDAAFTVEATRALYRYDWPRNVRELEKALEAAVALAGERPISLAHLPEAVRNPGAVPVGSSSASASSAARAPRREPLSDEERKRRDELVVLLTEHGGNVSAVARSLGKARVQIHRWLRRYGIALERFRSGEEEEGA